MQQSSFLRWRFQGSLLSASLLATLLLAVGCDPTVDILDPSDQYQYSIFGALNVAADTQVIRVEPIGDSTQIGAPKEINGTVRLENLDTGDQVVMQDSFMTVGGTEIRVHNFWTTQSIEPGTSYQVSIQRDGETITTATTVTPDQAPHLTEDSTFYLPCSTASNPEANRELNTFFVEVRNVERIAAADVIYPISFDYGQGVVQRRKMFSHYQAVDDRGAFFLVPVFYKPELTAINPDPPVGLEQKCTSKENFTHPYALVAISAAGPNWPDWRGVPLDELAKPDSYSNVKGGHGFVAGIYSDTLKVPILDRP